MPSPRSSLSGNQTIVAASTMQTTSGVSPSHAEGASPRLHHPQNMNPPPGFNIPDGTRQVLLASSSGSHHTMSDSMSQSPPVRISPGNPMTVNTPPWQQTGMFSPQSGQARDVAYATWNDDVRPPFPTGEANSSLSSDSRTSRTHTAPAV